MSDTTSTCYCGAIQISYSIEGDNLVDTFICHCTDDRKITGSMFASNFLLKSDTLKYVRGEDKVTKFAMTDTIATGHTMTSYFCSVCGSLMYRASSGFPGMTALRIGQVDDFEKHETVLKPRVEQFAGKRVKWLKQADGVEQQEGNYYSGFKSQI